MTLSFRRGRPVAEHVQSQLEDGQRALVVAEAERVRLRTTLDALGVGVILADRHGVVQVRNDAATRFSAHERVLVNAAVDPLLRRASRGAPGTDTLQFIGPPKRVLTIHATPLADGFALATIDDVSERARLDSVRTDFVANISHELKTPVGALAVLAEAAADSDTIDVMRRLTGRMVGEAHRAVRTIDDLLELSRIELGGRAVQEVVDVRSVMLDAIERTQAVADQRGITVQLREHQNVGDAPCGDAPGAKAPGAKALGDSRQLVSALANLIDNAVKYSDGGSTVVVGASTGDGCVDISVEDHGVGIPGRYLDRIFERFYRVDQARSRATGGTGLGLAIVRHVANNHGGDVLVRSQEGEGSTFTLRIPAAGEDRNVDS